MNILLTGGAGYIGSNVALKILDEGHKVTIIDNLVTGSKNLIPKNAKFINADISDNKIINQLLVENNFDLVLHFAGLVKVEESIKHPEKYYLYNYEKAKLFFQLCINNKLNKFIFSSTAAVYGDFDKNEKIKENNKLNPNNPYAKSKHKLENFLLNLSKEKKANCIILRYFNVAGADINLRSGLSSKGSNNLIKVLCELATKKKDKILINGNNYNTEDGTPVRDFIHISDLSEMHFLVALKLVKENFSDIYNCGYGRGYSVLQLISEMENLCNRKFNKNIGPRRTGDIPYSVANTDKFHKNYKWKPKYENISYILNSALEWEKKNNL